MHLTARHYILDSSYKLGINLYTFNFCKVKAAAAVNSPCESAAPSRTPPPPIWSPTAPARTSHSTKPASEEDKSPVTPVTPVTPISLSTLMDWLNTQTERPCYCSLTSSSLAISSAGVITSSWLSSWLTSHSSSNVASDILHKYPETHLRRDELDRRFFAPGTCLFPPRQLFSREVYGILSLDLGCKAGAV